MTTRKKNLKTIPEITVSDLSDSEKAKITRLVDKLVSLGKEHEEVLNSIKTIKSNNRNEVIELNAKLQQLEIDNNKLKEYQEASEKSYLIYLSLYQDKVEYLLNELNMCSTNLVDIETKYNHLSESRHHIELLCKSQRETIDTYETIRLKSQNEYDAIVHQLSDEKASILEECDKWKSLHITTESKNNSLQESLNIVTHQLDSINKLYDEKCLNVTEYMSQVQSLTSQLGTTQIHHQQKVSALQDEIQILRSKVTMLESTPVKSKKENDSCISNVETKQQESHTSPTTSLKKLSNSEISTIVDSATVSDMTMSNIWSAQNTSLISNNESHLNGKIMSSIKNSSKQTKKNNPIEDNVTANKSLKKKSLTRKIDSSVNSTMPKRTVDNSDMTEASSFSEKSNQSILRQSLELLTHSIHELNSQQQRKNSSHSNSKSKPSFRYEHSSKFKPSGFADHHNAKQIDPQYDTSLFILLDDMDTDT